MLGRLGLQLAGRRDVGHQRQMDVDGVVARQVVAELADRLQERHRLDVADGAADLAEDKIVVVIAVENEILDLVGDVRNDLDGCAEIVAAPLALDDVLVDAAGGDVVLLVGRAPGEALVMAEIEVGLGAVVGNEHFAMLVRATSSRGRRSDRGQAFLCALDSLAPAGGPQGPLQRCLFQVRKPRRQ